MGMTSKFRKTEIGLMPEDWQAVPLSSIGKFTKGSGIRKDQAQSGDIACVRYGELYTHHNEYIKSFNSHISKDVARSSVKLKSGDILFAGSGETKEEIGKCAAYIGSEEVYAGGDIIILSPQFANSLFLGFILNSKLVVMQKSRKGQGDAVVHISAKQLENILIPLPNLKEQGAIADSLFDIDSLIISLEKLITKKKNIKQGAMHKLLAERNGWKVKRLGDVCEIKKGQLITESTRTHGGIPVIAGGKSIAYYHNKANRYGKTITISGSGANAGYVSFHDYPIFASDCSTIGEDDGYSIDFIYYLLQLLQDKIYRMQTGGAQPHIHPSDLAPIIIPFPEKEKQLEIAVMLSDMDKELKELEICMNKYKTIKQGMMQNLLTGKIRLIK
ncbi:MAG: Type I restriction-modification system, specificity subunit S [Cytophagales bacterium]|jgi:type I restriction enzyme S subunit|nr:restriction endonuclease subunit S [Bacteroidota bacterium]WHZ06829.1 MAG: Type I restriction-modification system, specificity subunit S [Cytophagales bacterium]